MRTQLTLATFALLILLPIHALAYERPGALSLNGEWEFATCEPMIEIVPDRYVRPDFPTLSPDWNEVIDASAAIPWDSEWTPVEVPMAWENYTHPGYNEAGWYLRHVDFPMEWVDGLVGQAAVPAGNESQAGPPAPPRRIWLEFDAVATAAGVWVDGEFIAAHIGDYTRWRVELTDVVERKVERARQSGGEGYDAVSPYTLLIAVYVDELPGHITQGFLSMIAPHHGGIWQDVRMYSTGPVAIEPDGVHIEADAETGVVTATVTYDGVWDETWPEPEFVIQPFSGMRPEQYEFVISQYEDSFNWEVSPATQTLTLSMTVPNPLNWSPDSPILYYATVYLPDIYTSNLDWPSSDQLSTTFAFREIEIEGSDVLLNGEPIYIRSALNWGYYPGVYGPVPTLQQVVEEFTYIKSLGFNAETVCLINMPDYFYDIADEMGVLIWQEYPTWHNTFNSEHLPTYRREFPAYFARDRNHPIIIMRSISVEAGVEDQDVMGELVALAREMTDTPVQDNNSWFWLSNEELTDWYGEDNYLNNDQWARHMLNTLPGQLDELPAKPYIIGESILCNTWVDIDGLAEHIAPVGQAAAPANSEESQAGPPAPPFESTIPDWQPPDTMPNYLGGPSDYPWWFPSCYASCNKINFELRAKYNHLLPEGVDIVNDYLLPQSFRFNLAMRRFQSELMHADPRYAGYTVNVVRDMPLIRAGLIDDLGNPRWTPEEWSWHGDRTTSPVQAGEEDWSGLRLWEPELDSSGIDLSLYHVSVFEGGYLDVQEIVSGWATPYYVESTDQWEGTVIISSVLTNDLVDFIASGGVVILLTSKWPGGLGSHHHYFWRDSVFVSPFGPWAISGRDFPSTIWRTQTPSALNEESIPDQIIDLLQYDLIENKSEVIPVDALGITDEVDPLIRLYDTHDLSEVVAYDMAFATRVGKGMLIASSLDHSTDAGQWALKHLYLTAQTWEAVRLNIVSQSFNVEFSILNDYPQAKMSPERLHEFAVARANGIIPLDEGWQFALDPEQTGEAAGWMLPGFDDATWDAVRTGVSWEVLGYSYNGMGWYRKELEIPANWADGKVRLIAEGIDDAYTVWVNGQAVQTHGSFTVHEETVWLMQTVTDLTDYLVPGELNTIALQVVDITGQGGIYKPLYLAVE